MTTVIYKPMRVLLDLVDDEGDWIWVESLAAEYMLRRGVSPRSATRIIQAAIRRGLLEMRTVEGPFQGRRHERMEVRIRLERPDDWYDTERCPNCDGWIYDCGCEEL